MIIEDIVLFCVLALIFVYLEVCLYYEVVIFVVSAVLSGMIIYSDYIIVSGRLLNGLLD